MHRSMEAAQSLTLRKGLKSITCSFLLPQLSSDYIGLKHRRIDGGLGAAAQIFEFYIFQSMPGSRSGSKSTEYRCLFGSLN